MLICKRYKQAVKGLDTHLKDAYGLRKKKEQQPIIDSYARLALANPKDITTPLANGPPFKALGDPKVACQYDSCDWISTNCKTMHRHCNKEHQWHYSKKTPVYWTEVKVQLFFESFYQKYFVVQTESSTIVLSQVCLTEEQEDIKAQILQEIREARERDTEQQAVVEKEIEKSDNTGWWNLVRWCNYFAERNIKYIAYISRMPDRQDELLKQAVSVVDTIIKNTVNSLSSYYNNTLFWLRTANATNTVQNRPMV